jgi:PAS domain S-box-containing protein
MKTHDAELRKIKDLLQDNPKGMKISRIAGTLAMNRNAAAKYLEILLMTGQVELFEHGMSKIFILSRRTGIPTMLDRSEDLILVLDKDMKISQVNDNFLDVTGLVREDLLGKRPDAATIPIIGTPPVCSKIREAHYGADIRTEVRDVIRGTEFFFDVRMTPTAFNDGTRGITVIIGDITQEKRKQAVLADESRNLIEGVLSCIDDPALLLDYATGTVVFANPAALQLYRCPREELVGKSSGLVPGLAGRVFGDSGSLQVAFREQGYFETESSMKQSGGTFPVRLHLRPICNRKGDIRNVVMVIHEPSGSEGTGREAWNEVWAGPIRTAPSTIKLGSGWTGSVL